MGKNQEVEQKFPIRNANEVKEKLMIIGRQTVINQKQFDTYYMPSHKNYFESDIVSEWLRVRETDSKSSINYKCWLPIGAKIQTHCNEFQTTLTDVQSIQKILEALDVKPIIKVFKTRNSWEYKNVEVSIDSVEDLGDFIEIEYLNEVQESEVPKNLEFFAQVLLEIDAKVGEQDRRGYPYLMIEKSRKKF